MVDHRNHIPTVQVEFCLGICYRQREKDPERGRGEGDNLEKVPSEQIHRREAESEWRNVIFVTLLRRRKLHGDARRIIHDMTERLSERLSERLGVLTDQPCSIIRAYCRDNDISILNVEINERRGKFVEFILCQLFTARELDIFPKFGEDVGSGNVCGVVLLRRDYDFDGGIGFTPLDVGTGFDDDFLQQVLDPGI
jgi:hypothetical protein